MMLTRMLPASNPSSRRRSLQIAPGAEALSPAVERAIGRADWLPIALLAIVPTVAVLTSWMGDGWLMIALQFAASLAAFYIALISLHSSASFQATPLLLGSASLPIFGVLQLCFTHSAYRFATEKATLAWAGCAALAFVATVALKSHRRRETTLSAFLCLGVAACVLQVIQIFGYERYGTTASGYPLLSSNYFAELIELLLPIALTRALRRSKNALPSMAISTLFLATVFLSGARVGSLLVVIETTAAFLVAWRRASIPARRLKVSILFFLATLAAIFIVEGPGTLMERLREKDPLTARREMQSTAVEIFKAHPLFGTGLGTFSVVFPSATSFDNGYIVNDAHDDWLEFAAEGGFVFPLCLLALFAVSAASAWNSGWGLGILVLPLHALTDFPLQRFGILATLFVLMAAAAASASEKSALRSSQEVIRAWTEDASKQTKMDVLFARQKYLHSDFHNNL